MTATIAAVTSAASTTFACVLLASVLGGCDATVVAPITAGSAEASSGSGTTSAGAGGTASVTVGTGATNSSGGSTGIPVTGGPTPGACSGSGGAGGAMVESGPFTGVWTGYVENYAFADGTDTLRMNLEAIMAAVAGDMTFGDSAPPPPATDPDVGYPPGIDEFNRPVVYTGFSYSLLGGTFDGQRLKFTVAPNELWKEWCELQVSYADQSNAGNWGCVPNWGGGQMGTQCYQQNPVTQENVDVDCGKLALCAFVPTVCHCCAEGCTADIENSISFDMVLSPPAADGSVDGLGSSVHNVHLTL